MQANSILSKCIEIEPFGIRFGIRSIPCQQCNEKGFGSPFFALTDLLDVPPPLPRQSRPCRQWEPSPAGLRFGLCMVPLESGSCGLYLRGSSVRLMLRPADLLGPLTLPRATRVPALIRLRRSLPTPESPPAQVCYSYSVQSSLPRRDLHPLACQRTKAAQPANTWAWTFLISCAPGKRHIRLRGKLARAKKAIWL